MRPYILLAFSLLMFVMALGMACTAHNVTPAFGLSKDVAYLIIVAVAAWFMIAGAVIGYVSLLNNDRW